MFEDLFIDRGTIAKYHAAPLLEERLSYLRHCAQDGARTPTLRKIAVHQTSLIHFLDLHEGDRVNVAQVEAAAGQWSLPDGRSVQPARAAAGMSEILRPRSTMAAFRQAARRTLQSAACPRRRRRGLRGMDA